ncbi:hypothetical protein LQF12_13850 [Ruania suaedae]|uniref:hypothetical protein n=1 Tax=Ruania suaedae TaxID=2897774 RepID=UPI001E4286DC|nr:hypothetical protein [Ruania suaedae]UFU02561.1 hypothetical protein LQF12_13850 [Ruania suaedae]
MTEDAAITGELERLREQVTRLETMALRAWCAVTASLVCAGVLLPLGTEVRAVGDSGEEETRYLVLTTGFIFLEAARTGEGGDVALAALMAVGFLGLLLVALGCLAGLVLMAQRSASQRAATTFRVLMWLGLIGAGVTVIFSGLFVSAETAAGAGPGGLVLLAGMVAFALLLRPGARALWQHGR